MNEHEEFDFGKRCCFCGADNSRQQWGYAGERGCEECGHGGFGEPDLPFMAYKGNLHEAPLSSLAMIWRAR
jgi:hypothetical protein